MKKIKSVLGVLCVLTVFSAMALGSGSGGNVSKVDTASTGDTTKTTEKEEVVAKRGETLDFNGLQITFDSVERYVDTKEFVLDKAADGKEFVVLWFTVTNNSDSEQYLNMFYEDSYCDDFAIEPEALLYDYTGDSLFGATVASGKKARGYVAYQVSTTWQKLEFRYSPDIWTSSTKMIFEATPADIA